MGCARAGDRAGDRGRRPPVPGWRLGVEAHAAAPPSPPLRVGLAADEDKTDHHAAATAQVPGLGLERRRGPPPTAMIRSRHWDTCASGLDRTTSSSAMPDTVEHEAVCG
jgi:hypothetical protein